MKRILEKTFIEKIFVIIVVLLVSFFLFTLSSCSYDMSKITFADETVTYDGESHSIEISGTLSDEVTVSYTGNDQTEVGVYTVIASFEGENSWYDSITSLTATLTIVEADMTGLSFESETYTYDGEYHAIEVSGITDTTRYTVSYSNNSQKEVGVYSAIAIVTDTEGTYNDSYLTATLTIKYATSSDLSSATFESETYTYDGEYHTIVVSGITDTDRYTVSYSNNSQKDAGVYNALAIIADSEEIYETVYLTATLTIEEETSYDISFENEYAAYDGEIHSITATNLPIGVTATYSYGDDGEVDGETEVGTYLVTASFTDELGNYDIADMTATLYIQDEEFADVSIDDVTVTYDGNAHAITVSGLPSTVEASYTYDGVLVDNDYSGKTEAGTYEVVVSFTVDNDLYVVEDMYATLTIEQSDTLSDYVNFDDLYLNVYNLDSVTMTYSLVDSTVALPDGVEYTYSDNATQSDVGDYEVSVTFTDTNGNYADLTLTANMIVINDDTKTEDYTLDTDSNTHTATISEYTGSETEIIVPPYVIDTNYVAYKVISVDAETFMNNGDITSIEFNDNITSIGEECCSGCSKLESVVLPNNSEFSEITDKCFYNCVLLSLDLPSSVDTIGTYSFSYCKFTELDLSNVTSLGTYAFAYCEELVTLNLSDSLTEIPTSCFYVATVLSTVNSETVGVCNIPTNVITIGGYAFASASSTNSAMKKIVTNDNLIIIKGYAFSGYIGLTSIIFNDGLTSIGGYAFQGLSYSSSNTVSDLSIPSSVTNISDYCFQYNMSLTTLTFEGNGTSVGDYAFYYDSSLTTINTNDSDSTNEVTIGYYAFTSDNSSSYQMQLETVVLSENITSIGEYAFYYDESLTTITTTSNANSSIDSTDDNYMPESLETIKYSAFYNCSSLDGNMYFYDNLTDVSYYAFYNNSSLDDIYFGSSYSSLASTTIQSDAFAYCLDVDSVYLYGVSKVYTNSFEQCTSIDSVYFNTQIELIGYSVFDGATISNMDIYSISGTSVLSNVYFSIYDNSGLVDPAATLENDFLSSGYLCRIE